MKLTKTKLVIDTALVLTMGIVVISGLASTKLTGNNIRFVGRGLIYWSQIHQKFAYLLILLLVGHLLFRFDSLKTMGTQLMNLGKKQNTNDGN